MPFRIPGTPLLHCGALLSLCLVALGTGCQSAKRDTASAPPAPPTTAAAGQTVTLTALPVLKEKIKNDAPLDINDQAALHAMKPEERRQLLIESRKAKTAEGSGSGK